MGRKGNLIKKNAESANNPSLRNFAKQSCGNPPIEKAKVLQNGLPRRFCESARNDKFLDSSLRFLSAHNDNLGESAESALEIFYQICKIPHPSGKTQKLREFLIDFLRACACEVKSDSAGNIHALKGAPNVVFQAHYDMVLVGDEVVPFIEDGFLKARDSSLGADNGAAVALLLCLAKTRKNIEILLTNDEEIGMLGAKNLALQTHSKKMINLDSECVEEICVGCAGGFDADIDLGNLFWGMQFRTCEKFWESADSGLALSQNFSQIQKPHRHYFDCDSQSKSTAKKPQNAESSKIISSLRDSAKQNRGKPPIKKTQNLQGGLPRATSRARNDNLFYEFSAHNFKGGHSGIDIDKNIKNAIVELLYALDSARQMGEFEILEISGGEARNSIPINAHAIIAIKTPINPTQTAESTPHIAIKKLAHYTPKQKPLKSAVVPYLLRLHNGIYKVENGSVTSSLNFSIINNKTLKIMVRGNKAECLEEQILRLRYLFGEAVKISGFYNAWEANLASCGDFLETASACKSAESKQNNFVILSKAKNLKNNPSLRADSQNLRGNPPYENTQNLQCGLPRSHSLARNGEILDSSLRLRSAQNDKIKQSQNDKNSARGAESNADSANQAKSAESTLLSTLSCIYTKHKIPFKIIQIHAGLECGILKEKCALDEVISIGPTILHPHSKGEMMDLASFGRFCDIVEDLC